MKVLSLSLDSQILEQHSAVADRTIGYGSALEAYTVIVPSLERKNIQLSPRVIVYATGGANRAAQLLRVFFLARKLLKETQYDVITSQDAYFLGLVAALIAHVYRCGLEIQIHGIEKLTFLRKRMMAFTLSRAGSIRMVSNRLLRYLKTEIAVPEDRVAIAPVYMDVSFLEQDAEAAKDAATSDFQLKYADRFNIVSVNRLVPIKNIAMQLQAICKLKDEFPHILLHVVGAGPDSKMLLQLIQELQISSQVVLQGAKSKQELIPFYLQSDCFVLTSDFEGYGMVVAEAASAGLPIVMTDVGCAGELVFNRESALIVPARDIAAFTRALREVITDDALRASLQEQARMRAKSLPSFDETLSMYKASWEQALLKTHLKH